MRSLPDEDTALRMELLERSRSRGLRIAEVPILFAEPPEGSTPMSWRALVSGARAVLRLTAARYGWTHRPRDPIAERHASSTPAVGTARRENILVLALGGIGDTVMSFAMMRRLRRIRPSARITVLTMWPQSAELLEDLGVFDEVLQHHFQRAPRGQSLKMVALLRRRRFDLSLQAFPANRFEYNVVHWLIGAPKRLGHDYLRGSRWTYLRWLLTDRVSQSLGEHNIRENLKLLELLGDAPLLEPFDTSLGPLDPEFHAYADDCLGCIDGPVVGMHAGSSAYKNLHAKRWPAERFAELGQRLHEEYGWTPLLFGSPDDRPIHEAIASRCPQARIVETPSIRNSAALIQRCVLFVSNDTAPAHIASALEVPTVMLVGPTDAMEIGPFCRLGAAVTVTPTCAPCFRVSRRAVQCLHPGLFTCMKLITVERVLEEVGRLVPAHLRSSRRGEYGSEEDRDGRPSLLVLDGRGEASGQLRG